MKRWLVLAAVAAWAAPAEAQQYWFGLLGGPAVGDQSISGSNNPNLPNAQARWGPHVAGFVLYAPARNLIGGLEPGYISKGGGETRLDYLEIPFTAGAIIPAAQGDMTFRFYTGVALGIKVGCDNSTVGLTCDQAEGTEWSIPFGFTFGRRVSSGTFIGADIRYALGLTSTFEASTLKNRTWSFRFMVGWPKR